MFDILQGDMTRSKVILMFTCLKMYILREQATLVVREPPCSLFSLNKPVMFVKFTPVKRFSIHSSFQQINFYIVLTHNDDTVIFEYNL